MTRHVALLRGWVWVIKDKIAPVPIFGKKKQKNPQKNNFKDLLLQNLEMFQLNLGI